MWKLLRPLFTSGGFWIVCLMNVGLTLIRETFNLWNPTYLKEVARLDVGKASISSLVFPLCGAVSSLLAGWLVDRANGRYEVILVPLLVLLTVVLITFALIPIGDLPDEIRAPVALTLISAVAFLLLAPYTFCSGALAVKIGGQRGGATTAGIIDTAGYLGATLAGSGMGRVADRYGWSIAFVVLATVAFVTLAVSIWYGLAEQWKRRGGNSP